jgi:hypothetical protein
MVTKLEGIATPFGPLGMELKVADDGASAHLNLQPLGDPSCRKIVVHLGGWASPRADAAIELEAGSEHHRTIPISRGGTVK